MVTQRRLWNQGALVEMGHEKGLGGHICLHVIRTPREKLSTQMVPLSPKLSPPEWKRVIWMYTQTLKLSHTTYMRVALPFWCLCPDWLRGRWVVGVGGSGTWDSPLLRAPGHDPIYFSIPAQGKAQCIKPDVPITPGRSFTAVSQDVWACFRQQANCWLLIWFYWRLIVFFKTEWSTGQ